MKCLAILGILGAIGFLFLEFCSYSACTNYHEMTVKITSVKPVNEVEWDFFTDKKEANDASTNLYLEKKNKTPFVGREVKVVLTYGSHVSMILQRELLPWRTRYLVVIAHFIDGTRKGKTVKMEKLVPSIEVTFP